MTRILLADDHALFRQGLERVLAEQRMVVCQKDARHSGIETLTTVPRPGSP